MSRYLKLGIINRILSEQRFQRVDTICTSSSQSSSAKSGMQVDKKYALMTKKDIEYHEAHNNVIKIDKPEVLSVITGVPEEHIKGRLVRISLASKNPMQSGTDNTQSWVMDFDTRERWENPLMGWTSTGDPLSNLQLHFSDKEQAIEFCDKIGWEWFVEPEKPKPPRVKNYGFNFSWNKRTRVSTK